MDAIAQDIIVVDHPNGGYQIRVGSYAKRGRPASATATCKSGPGVNADVAVKPGRPVGSAQGVSLSNPVTMGRPRRLPVSLMKASLSAPENAYPSVAYSPKPTRPFCSMALIGKPMKFATVGRRLPPAG